MNRRVFAATWCAGLPGVIVVAWLGLPEILAGKALPVPMWVLSLASGIQTSLLLAVAAFAGTRLAPGVGLHAPALSALAESRAPWSVLGKQLVPGLCGGLLGGALLWAISRLAADVAAPLQGVTLPAVVRLLYGGITEEVLVRWGLMSAMAWVLWRVVQRDRSKPSVWIFWAAIAGSALLFGAGHLPAAFAMAGAPSAGLVVYIVGANAAFGIVAGYLFWRHGLEAAMIAHLLAHAVLMALRPQ